MSGDLEMGGSAAAARTAAESQDVAPRDLGRVWRRPKERGCADHLLFCPIFVLCVLIAIVLPPLSLWLQKRNLQQLLQIEIDRRAKAARERYQWEYDRCKRNLNINLALTLFGWIGGSIHALFCLHSFPWYLGA